MACQNNAGNNAMNCYSADAIAKDVRAKKIVKNTIYSSHVSNIPYNMIV